MLQMNIKTKQDLLKLLQGSEIKLVVAKDVFTPEDLNEVKKSALSMLRNKSPITVFLVAN